jgi:predicted AlkP superfamily pyrophosphatase or phosphodiesterase
MEYLYRYYDKFGDGGFKRLLTDGFTLKNAHYNYAPTKTAPGHASNYTGTTPAVHGIIGNDWYDKELKKNVYCAGDENVSTVGSNSEKEGKMSPRRILVTTVTDELRMSTQKRSIVIGLSVKDRGAIMPTGHTANAAYWYDPKSGRFITSTYYMQSLPDWLEKFNAKKLADKYMSMTWERSLPADQYVESGQDETAYETKFQGKSNVSFPYDLRKINASDGAYDILSYTPFSNDYLNEMAKSTIDGEKMGQDEWTDFLAISYSAPDKLIHEVGPNSVEAEDMYIRLDKTIEDLLRALDSKVGQGNYLVFLTSDHGIPDVPKYLADNKIPAGTIRIREMKERLNQYLKQFYPGDDIVEQIINEQVFLHHEAFGTNPRSGGIDLLIATELISNFLMQEKFVANVYSKALIRQGDFAEGGYKGLIIRGYNFKRSGDIVFILEPGWINRSSTTGTDHGSPYSYDTHVPILFYGIGIKKGSSVRYYSITDIAPTISVLLSIRFPNGCTGQPIEELFED